MKSQVALFGKPNTTESYKANGGGGSGRGGGRRGHEQDFLRCSVDKNIGVYISDRNNLKNLMIEWKKIEKKII
jgi:hypothetical protein